MEKQKNESGYFWVPKSMTCNGCKYLNFYKEGCKRNLPPGQVRQLSSYKNGDGYLAMLRPPDCDYERQPKAEPQPESIGKEDGPVTGAA